MEVTKEQLELDYGSGLSMSEIGRKHNISTAAVFRRMKIHGIQSRPPSQAMKGKPCPPEVAAKISAANIGKKKTAEHRQKLSESKKGSKHPNYGKKQLHGKRIWYQQPNGSWVAMRSSWETAYASWLDNQGAAWEYESKTYVLSDGSAYTPDFWLPESSKHIEVKGWMRAKWQDKYERFRADYPAVDIVLADRAYLESLGIDLKQLFTSTRPKFACEQCGKEFYRIYKTQRMCSRVCRNKYIACHRKKKRSKCRS
jgi:hypothetical protein